MAAVSLSWPTDLASGLVYRDRLHQCLPHVVRFSGGRSSALMLLELANAGVLRPDRGDIVLFANTTAEHPGTYEFARSVCEEVESDFGVPCFWYEGCTVETATRFGYTRVRTFKLVKRVPADDSDDPSQPGYRWRGEAFEEMASWSRLPSRWRRMCTTELKVQPGHDLISEWLWGGPGPARQGHYRDVSLATATDVAERYRGALGRETREARLQMACGEPWARPQQNWQDFTTVQLNRPVSGPRGSADIWGRYGDVQKFVSLLGLRADEPKRVQTAMWRAFLAEGAGSTGCRDRIQPAGEVVYCPLSDGGITEEAVQLFWAAQKYDLRIPDGAGNCVYCFLKGPAALARLAATADGGDEVQDTPVDIRWWARLEDDYGRPSTNGFRQTIGMFHDTDYRAIMHRASDMDLPRMNTRKTDSDDMGVPCSCTD